MELFIPSLLVLLLGAVVAFFLIPKMTPYTIGFLSIALFVVGVWQNYTMFPDEYRASFFTSFLKDYSPFVMIIAVIIGGMVIMTAVFGKNPPSITEVIPEIVAPIASILPAMNTNATKNANNKRNNAGLADMIPNIFNNTKANNGRVNNNTTKANNGGVASSSFKIV